MDAMLTGKERSHGHLGAHHKKNMSESMLSTNCAHSKCWETHHVQKVYNLIAPHYNDVRHRTWPKVNRFLKSLQPGSLVADVGCGNGRYLSVNPQIYKFGSDICSPFLEQARDEGHEIMAADNMTLPYRNALFDAVCSIGVIHHFSSLDRRIRAIQELARITSTGGKVMIYVWAYEQTKRKFASQDVLIPWIKPDNSGVFCSKLGDMESNTSCSIDSSDSQDDPLVTDTDTITTGLETVTFNQKGLAQAELASRDAAKQEHLHRYIGPSFENHADASASDGDRTFSQCLGYDGTSKICDRTSTMYEGDVIDERDIEWSPPEDECTNSNGILSYPRQLVAECKKLGRLLRHLTNRNDCRHSVDCEDDEEDMYEDSVDEVLLRCGSSVKFRWDDTHARDGDTPAFCENGVIPLSCPPDSTGDEESSVASTLRQLEDSYQMLINSDCSSFEWGSGASQSTVLPTSTTSEDATVTDEWLLSSGSSSSSLCDASDAVSSLRDKKDQTPTSQTTSAKSTFCPFSRSPPEVPSDTSVSESCTEDSSVYSQLNSRLAKLNSNSKDVTCHQSLHNYQCTSDRLDGTNDVVRHELSCNKIPPANNIVKHKYSCDKTPPSNDKVKGEHSCDNTNNPDTVVKNSTLAKKDLGSRPLNENRNTFQPLSSKNVNKNTYTEPVNETASTRPSNHRDTFKNNTTQTGRRHDQLLYVLALRQNLKNVFSKIVDAFHVNKKSGSVPATCPPIKDNRRSNLPQKPPPKAKKIDEVTLQYYREVCFFPPNNQYQSMKTCLHKAPVSKSPHVIQGKRHGFLNVARRLSGAKDPIPQSNVAVAEESRKLTLSDALTMIGDGYSADSICDKLDSSAKKVFLEMKRVNFGIRQFPCSSVDGEDDSPKRAGEQVDINDSLLEIKEAAWCAAAQVVDRLHDAKHLAQETVHNGLVQLAQTALRKGEEHCDSINGSFRQTCATVEISAAKFTDLGPAVLLGKDILLPGTKMVRKMSCQNTSNNAAVCEYVTLDTCDGHFVDNMLDVKPSPQLTINDPEFDSQHSCEFSRSSPSKVDSERSRIIASMSRYYHVFRQGELEALIKDHVPSLLIVDSYYDHANWCIIAQKI